MIIIPISGKAQHGKDTFANELKKSLEKLNKKVLITHYADYLKMVAKNYYNWDGNKDENGRHILQYLGTDKARKNNPKIWVNVVKELIEAIGEDYDYILIPDCRFPDEIETLKDKYYNEVLSLRVHRDNFESTLTKEQKQHLSETALDNYNFDINVHCESGLESVRNSVNSFIKEVLNID